MHKKILMTILLAISFTVPAMAETDSNVMEARKIIKQFFTQLKGELQKAMKEGGPVHAISVCNEKAPKIADDISASTGWYVARTSLKPRAPTNSPLPWEKKVLEQFEQQKAAGKEIKTIDYSEVVEEDGKKVFRYMNYPGVRLEKSSTLKTNLNRFTARSSIKTSISVHTLKF
jgi:hypothetical protein